MHDRHSKYCDLLVVFGIGGYSLSLDLLNLAQLF